MVHSERVCETQRALLRHTEPFATQRVPHSLASHLLHKFYGTLYPCPRHAAARSRSAFAGYLSRSHCAADRATHQAPRTSAYAATQALPLQIRHTRVMRYLPTQHQRARVCTRQRSAHTRMPYACYQHAVHAPRT